MAAPSLPRPHHRPLACCSMAMAAMTSSCLLAIAGAMAAAMITSMDDPILTDGMQFLVVIHPDGALAHASHIAHLPTVMPHCHHHCLRCVVIHHPWQLREQREHGRGNEPHPLLPSPTSPPPSLVTWVNSHCQLTMTQPVPDRLRRRRCWT